VAGFRYPNGTITSQDLTPSNTSPCDITNLTIPTYNTDNAPLAFVFHTHMFAPGEKVTLTQCGNRKLSGDQYYIPGPSNYQTANPDDWSLLNALNSKLKLEGQPPIPGYIYDKALAYRMNPNGTNGEEPVDQWSSYDRTNTSCIWH
jgi:hypothetical protein